MTELLILDSNAIIALFDGNTAAARLLGDATRILVPATVCGEIDAGTQGNTKRETATREAFASFLSMDQVSVQPITRRTGAFYARIYSFLKEVGKPIPTNDIWIAATVLETGGLLLTADKHLLSLPLIRTHYL